MCPLARFGSRFRPNQCDLVETGLRRSWSRIVPIHSQSHALHARQAVPRITAFGARVRSSCLGEASMRLGRIVALALAVTFVVAACGGTSTTPTSNKLKVAFIWV